MVDSVRSQSHSQIRVELKPPTCCQRIWNTIKAIFLRIFATQNYLKKFDSSRVKKLSLQEINFLSRKQLLALKLTNLAKNQIMGLKEKTLLKILNSTALDSIVNRLALKQLKLVLRAPKLAVLPIAIKLTERQITPLVEEAAKGRSSAPRRILKLVEHTQNQFPFIWNRCSIKAKAYLFKIRNDQLPLVRKLKGRELLAFLNEFKKEDLKFIESLDVKTLYELLDYDTNFLEFCTTDQVTELLSLAEHDDGQYIRIIKAFCSSSKKLPIVLSRVSVKGSELIRSNINTLEKREQLRLIDSWCLGREFFPSLWLEVMKFRKKWSSYTEKDLAMYVSSTYPEKEKIELLKAIKGTEKIQAIAGLANHLKDPIDFLGKVGELTPDELRLFFQGFVPKSTTYLFSIETALNQVRSLPFIKQDLSQHEDDFEILLPMLTPDQIKKYSKWIESSNIIERCRKVMIPGNSLCNEQVSIMLSLFPNKLENFCDTFGNKPLPDCVFPLLVNSEVPFSQVFGIIKKDCILKEVDLYERMPTLLSDNKRLEECLEFLVENQYNGLGKLFSLANNNLNDAQKIALISRIEGHFTNIVEQLRWKANQLPDTNQSFKSEDLARLRDIKTLLPFAKGFSKLLDVFKSTHLRPKIEAAQNELEDVLDKVENPWEKVDGPSVIDMYACYEDDLDIFGFLGLYNCNKKELRDLIGTENFEDIYQIGTEVGDLKEKGLYQTGDSIQDIRARVKNYLENNVS